ncbi:MAG: hypothetical protein U0Y68_05570 [Blastocatellia bacterium]
MRRKFSTLLLSGLLIFTFALRPVQAQSSPEEKLRARVVEWGPNKAVAIELKSGEKLQGRIAEIKDDALSIQFLQQGKIDTRAFRWSEIKKVSLKQSTENKVRKTSGFIALGVLVALAVVIGVGLSQLD